jgi:hypothetical protein
MSAGQGRVTFLDAVQALARIDQAGDHPAPADLATLARFGAENPDLLAASAARWAAKTDAELDALLAAGGGWDALRPAWYDTAPPLALAAMGTIDDLQEQARADVAQ